MSHLTIFATTIALFVVGLVLQVAVECSACDSGKAINELIVHLEPNVTHTEYWDFRDCWFGITGDTFYITAPRDKRSFQGCLPPKTRIEAHLFDLTTGTEYFGAVGKGCTIFYCVNQCDSVCGHVLQLDLTLRSAKAVDAAITQTANWGGPCQ